MARLRIEQSSTCGDESPSDRHIRKNLPHYFVAALGLLLIVAVGVAHRYNPAQPTALVDKFIHSLHGPGFAAVAILIFLVLREYNNRIENYLHAAVISIVIGGLSEAAQIPGPRDAEVLDLIVDAIGIAGGLGCIACIDGGVRKVLRKGRWVALVLVSGVCTVIAFGPSAWYTHTMIRQHQAKPQLVSFDASWETVLYSQRRRLRPDRVPMPDNWPVESEFIGHAEEASRYGILIDIQPFPNWSDYSVLTFVASSANGGTHEVMLSVRDIRPRGRKSSVRYTEVISLGPTPTIFRIPIDRIRAASNDRPFDIAHVDSVTLSAANPGHGVEIYMDDFRLER